jgi:tRNA pseudouridine55 synthase
LNGVLVIDKPKGWTSHDVVARVRNLLRIRKAGHGGTLDPLATGVLPVYVGEATKLVPFNLEGTKEYHARMRLGQETDTQDADGRVTAEKSGFFFLREEVEGVLCRFRGRIQQTPPIYSAVKQNGVPLYKMARAGKKPAVAAREVVIEALRLKDLDLPYAEIEVTCSRGTYIRSLCADIGRDLGCGAHVAELRRLRSGKFRMEQALTLEDVDRLRNSNELGERLIPMKDGVDMDGSIRVEERVIPAIRQGRPVPLSKIAAGECRSLRRGQRVCLLGGGNELLAIAEADGGPGPEPIGALRILRVFHG